MARFSNADILEIYRFLAPVCLAISNGRFQNIKHDNIWELSFITDLISNKTPADVGFWRQLAEDVGSLSLYLAGASRREMFAELSQDKNHLQYCFDNLQDLLAILIALEKHHPSCEFLEDAFSGRYGVSYIKGTFVGNGKLPELKIWKHYLTQKEFKQIERCLDNNGDWKKSVSSIKSAYEIAFPLVINLVKESK